MHKCSRFIPFRIYRSQPPRCLTCARTYTAPALRSRVRTALILFLFSSVTFWGRILTQKAQIRIYDITCYTNLEEPTMSRTEHITLNVTKLKETTARSRLTMILRSWKRKVQLHNVKTEQFFPDELIQISEKTALIWPSKVCRTFGQEAAKGKVKKLCSVKRDTSTPCI
jgi:hypothetical protein